MCQPVEIDIRITSTYGCARHHVRDPVSTNDEARSSFVIRQQIICIDMVRWNDLSLTHECTKRVLQSAVIYDWTYWMHNVNQQVSYSREKRNTNRVTLSRHSNARAIRRPSANSLMASSSCVFIINNCAVVTTSVNSRRPSVHKRLMTPLFGNCFSAITSLLFAIDRKVFLESVNSCVYMQIFNFRDGHVTTLRHHSGAYICQMPGHRLSRLAKGIQSESLLSIGVKLFPVGSAQDSRRVPKNAKNAVFGSGSAHATKFGNLSL